MEITFKVTVKIGEDAGYSDSDVSSLFHGMGRFADVVKDYVEEELEEIKVDEVEIA